MIKDCVSTVVSNEKLTDSLYLMRLEAPYIAQNVKPAQFVHMSIPSLRDHILRRPFSIYDADADMGTVDIIYQVVGAGTEDMTFWEPGYETTMIGPIGNRWEYPDGINKALLIGGGVGAAPLFLLCKEMVEKGIEVDVVLGAQTKDALICLGDYEQICSSNPRCSTDDGTFGEEGFCTVVAEKAVTEAAEAGKQYDYAAVCGPIPLMRAGSKITMEADIPTQISLEKRMACGVGACLSCVVNTKDGKRRACVDGPVFEAEEVIW